MSAQVIKYKTLKKFNTADVVEVMGSKNIISREIYPITFCGKILGPAYTVLLPQGDLYTTIPALKNIPTGNILVIDGKLCSELAVFGEGFGTVCSVKKVEGVVIDGYLRDIEGLKKLDVTIYAKGLSLRAAKVEETGKINVPVVIGGVVINPGDYLFGDEDGIVVIPKEEIEEILPKTKAFCLKSRATLKKVKESKDPLKFTH